MANGSSCLELTVDCGRITARPEVILAIEVLAGYLAAVQRNGSELLGSYKRLPERWA